MNGRPAPGRGGGGAPDRGAAAPGVGALAARGPARRFGWWPRFAVWMLALSVPAVFLADAYHGGLRAVTSFVLAMRLPPQPPEAVEVSAVQVLAAYAAMCLASLHSSWPRRLVALSVGVPLLFGLEAMTGIVMIRSELMAGAGGLPAWVVRARDQILFAPPWLGAPLAWLVLLGRYELPRLGLPAKGRPVSR